MGTITHSQVQELVKKLPVAKLERVYGMLLKLTEKKPVPGSPQLDFIKLTLSQRRKIMKKQAEQMASYYKEKETERGEWQGGEFLDEY